MKLMKYGGCHQIGRLPNFRSRFQTNIPLDAIYEVQDFLFLELSRSKRGLEWCQASFSSRSDWTQHACQICQLQWKPPKGSGRPSTSHWRHSQTVMKLAMIKGSKAMNWIQVSDVLQFQELKWCQVWNSPLAAAMAAEAGALSTVFCTCRLLASQLEANVGLLSFSKRLSLTILPWAHE